MLCFAAWQQVGLHPGGVVGCMGFEGVALEVTLMRRMCREPAGACSEPWGTCRQLASESCRPRLFRDVWSVACKSLCRVWRVAEAVQHLEWVPLLLLLPLLLLMLMMMLLGELNEHCVPLRVCVVAVFWSLNTYQIVHILHTLCCLMLH